MVFDKSEPLVVAMAEPSLRTQLWRALRWARGKGWGWSGGALARK